jgi:hypothetical protein
MQGEDDGTYYMLSQATKEGVWRAQGAKELAQSVHIQGVATNIHNFIFLFSL